MYEAAEFIEDQIVLDPQYVLDVVRQDELVPAGEGPVTLERIKLMIQREVRTQGKVQITDDLLIAAYNQCGSYREAAIFLTQQCGEKVSKDRVRRAVIKDGGKRATSSDRVSDSIVRSTGRDRRDTAHGKSRLIPQKVIFRPVTILSSLLSAGRRLSTKICQTRVHGTTVAMQPVR